MNTGQFFDRVEQLYPDWQYDHPRALYALIKLLKPASVLEVGAFIGYGACYMARALEENGIGHLYCIDCWQLPLPGGRIGSVKEHFERSLSECGLRPLVTLIEGKSSEVPWPSAELVYIDGWHSYEVALHDIKKAMAIGAKCICLDDALAVVGVRLAIEDFIMKNSDWSVIRLPSAAGFAICVRNTWPDSRPITFSQEIDGKPGMSIEGWSQEQIDEHVKLHSTRRV